MQWEETPDHVRKLNLLGAATERSAPCTECQEVDEHEFVHPAVAMQVIARGENV